MRRESHQVSLSKFIIKYFLPRTFAMTIENSKLIDADQMVINVLDKVVFRLFGGYLWQTEDINEATAKGSEHHAFENPPAKSVASLTIVDVSNDPDEPDVSRLTASDISKVDQILRESISSQLTVVEWKPSQLNELGDMKGLVSLYIAEEDGLRWQYIATRIFHNSRKWAMIGMFDTAKHDPLAGRVFGSMKSIGFLDKD